MCRKYSGLLHLPHGGLHLLRCHGLLRKSSRQGICGLLRLGSHGCPAPAGTLVVVDQFRNIGSLAVRRARAAGLAVAYLPGLAASRAAGLF